MKNTARVKESSVTTGLGSYDLASAGTHLRRFRDALASGEKCFYFAADAANFERGIGTLTTGSPDTLSRDVIIQSSNAGAKVNWAAGTRDLFIDPLPGTAPLIGYSGAATIDATMIGAYIRFTGSSIATWSLTAAASMGDGFSFIAKNDGTATLTLDPNSTELINGASTLALAAGEWAIVVCDGTAWRAAVYTLPAAAPAAATQAEQEAASSTSVTVTPGRQHFHPGSAKAWVTFDGSAGTPDSTKTHYGVSSITDNGTGDWTVNWSTAFSSAAYAYALGAEKPAANLASLHVKAGGQAAGSLRIATMDASYALVDVPKICVVAFGDFA